MSLGAWLANLAAYSAQLGALVLVGGALPLLARLRAPRWLLIYWHSLLALCLLLPLLQPWRHEVVAGAVTSGPVVVFRPDRPAPAPPQPFPTRQAVAAALAAGLAWRLAWLGLGLCRLAAYRRRGRALEPPPAAVEEIQARLGVRAELRCSPQVRSPVTFGLLRPVVLLPASFLEMPEGQQAAIACHELVHVRRGDWAFSLAGELIRAVLWFHPAVWWLLGRIQLAREQVVDAEVIALTGARRPYLDALLAVASVRRPAVAALAPLFLGRRHFGQRVVSILEEVPMSRFRLSVSVAAIGGLVVLTGGLAARAFPLQGAPQSEPAPQSERQRIRVGGGVQEKKLVHQVHPVYPPLAKQARIQGTVRFTAIIGTDGTIRNLQLISGHPLLIPAAQEAVQQWRYQPTLLNGQPVEVITQVDVNFSLGGGAPGKALAESLPPPPTSIPFASIEPEKGVRRIQVPAADQEEKLIYRQAPLYPPLAQQARVRGTVTCHILITADGAVKAVQVASGHPLLAPAATEAVKQSRYRPTIVDGQPAEVVTQVEVKVPVEELWTAAAAPEVASPDVHKVGKEVIRPTLIRRVEPRYSEEARAAKLEGTVVLMVEVWPDGKIHNARVEKGLGLGLNEKALEAVQQWEFQPATLNGAPVKVAASIEVNFRLM